MCHTFLKGRMFSCSADCCSRPSDSMSQVHQCIDRCHAPLAQAQGLVTSELEKFQVRGVHFYTCANLASLSGVVRVKRLEKKKHLIAKKRSLSTKLNTCLKKSISVLSCILCEILSLCVTFPNTHFPNTQLYLFPPRIDSPGARCTATTKQRTSLIRVPRSQPFARWWTAVWAVAWTTTLTWSPAWPENSKIIWTRFRSEQGDWGLDHASLTNQ